MNDIIVSQNQEALKKLVVFNVWFMWFEQTYVLVCNTCVTASDSIEIDDQTVEIRYHFELLWVGQFACPLIFETVPLKKVHKYIYQIRIRKCRRWCKTKHTG